MGKQPYGYLRNKDNPKQWVVDEEAAEVVKKYIYLLDGKGPMQIAKMVPGKSLTIKPTRKMRRKALPTIRIYYANSVSAVFRSAFPYGEKRSWRTRRPARYRENVSDLALCCAATNLRRFLCQGANRADLRKAERG